MSLKRGEPQLTMTSIFSLDDLAPFFAAICDGVTRQQTRIKPKNVFEPNPCDSSDKVGHYEKLSRQTASSSTAPSSLQLIDAILEKDFLESVTKQ